MTPHFPIYMDYGATTPVDPRVVDAMIPWLREHFGNPASRSHAWGWEAEEAVEKARGQVAALIGADPREIVWTSGAPESNNLAIKGAAHFYQSRGKHLVTVKTEHKAVLDTTRELERQGFEVTYLDVQENGLLDLDRFKAALRPDTILASVMLVNNEIGVIQDIATIGAMCRERGVIFHVDAAQATGKVAINLMALPVDLMSLASHKTYGPKGIGALYVRHGTHILAQQQGGTQERHRRAGTEDVAGAVGLATAYERTCAERAETVARLRRQRDRLAKAVLAVPGTELTGHPKTRLAGHFSMVARDTDGASTAVALDLEGIAASVGSACTTGSTEVSHVLTAMGYPEEEARGALRLSLGRTTTDEEVATACEIVPRVVASMRVGAAMVAADPLGQGVPA